MSSASNNTRVWEPEPLGYGAYTRALLDVSSSKFGYWYYWGYFTIPTGECHAP